MKLTFLQRKTTIAQRGFTIVELMVTITIVVLVTGLIMVQYSSFNNSILLKSQAYLTAFDLREAQALAVSIKGRSSEFREEYGIFFDIATPGEYLLFQDNASFGVHSPAHFDVGEEVGQPYRVDPRFMITDLCVTTTVKTCHSTGGTPSTLAVSFERPDFDANFYVQGVTNIQSADIVIGTAEGTVERTVTIYQTGQISIR
jgi:prepilin-type N-terminal cleavage/methylation domain-containing protein